MMLKIGSQYLDFNDDIEVERQSKIIEELDKSAGDFSYEFEIELTSNNIRILQCPFPDNISKNVYHKINAEAKGEDGITLYYGFIRIQGIVGNVARCSFFSGNNNWFSMLSGEMSEIDFSDLEVDQNEANIVASWSQDSGNVFPLVDNNVLLNRKAQILKVEDFVPATYVHTIVKRIFQHHSIKINGELLSDPNYKRLAISRSPSDSVESRSAYVGKNSTQSIGTSIEVINFDDDSNFPFFDGSQNNYNLVSSEYNADVKMRIKIEANVTFENTFEFVAVYIVKNGVEVNHVFFNPFLSANKSITVENEIILEAGDQITLWADAATNPINITAATMRFTPTYIYVAFGDSVIPKWTQQEFISNIFRLFCVLPSYEPVTKTLTLNIFDKIASKDPIDISEYISFSETDYADFISNYGKRSTATYDRIDFDDWLVNGVSTFFESGDGALDVDNDFIDDSSELIQSDFTNPQSYIHSIFDMSMERLNTLELESIDDTEATSVADSSGMARFNINEDIFVVGDLVRISESTVSGYIGDWVVLNVGPGWVEFYGMYFDDDTTARLDLMKHVYTEEDNVYLFFVVPNYTINKMSGSLLYMFEGTDRSAMSFGYFNIMNTGRQVNDEFIQSLSFGEVDSNLFYQRTMLQTYWRLANKILNDPVKQIVTVNLPYSLFTGIDFLAPVAIKTLESSNKYFPSRMTGYKGKEFDSTIELIKLP